MKIAEPDRLPFDFEVVFLTLQKMHFLQKSSLRSHKLKELTSLQIFSQMFMFSNNQLPQMCEQLRLFYENSMLLGYTIQYQNWCLVPPPFKNIFFARLNKSIIITCKRKLLLSPYTTYQINFVATPSATNIIRWYLVISLISFHIIKLQVID